MKRVSKEERENAIKNARPPEIAMMAMHIAAWYKAFYVQTKAWFKSMNADDELFVIPWDRESPIPCFVQRYYWIQVLHHLLSDLADLSKALERFNDRRITDYVDELLNLDGFQSKVAAVRNSIEHWDDYMVGAGNAQTTYQKQVQIGDMLFNTNSHWLITVKDEVYLGDLNCIDAIKRVATYRDKIIPLLDSIVNDYWIKDSVD